MGFIAVDAAPVRGMIRISLLPDMATNAWLVAGSTARPPKSVKGVEAPPAVTVTCEVPVPGSLICCWKVVRVEASQLVRQFEETLQTNETRCNVAGSEIDT